VAALTGIRITKPPAKVSYLSGEPLDLAGLEAAGIWQGADDAPVTPEYVSGFDANAQGNQTVIVEALGKRASFTVTVKEPADPVTWTPVQGVFAKNISGIAYGNGRFVAVGYDDKPEEKIAAYSTDGITWTKAPSQAAGLFAKNIIGIVYGNGIFVAAGYNDDKNEGYVSDNPNESIIVYSTDGSTWTRASTPKRFKNCNIVFGNGRFVTIGSYDYQETGTQQWTISYYQVESSDGITWSERKPLFAGSPEVMKAMAEAWSRVRYVFFDGGKFIALAETGQYLYSTDNGKSWKAGEEIITINGRPITGVVSGNGKMIGVGPNNAIGWSTDGIIWTDADRIGEGLRGGDLNAVAYGFGMFVAAGSRGNIIYSRSGYTWTKVPSSTFGSTSIHYAAYGGGRFIAIGSNGRIAYSNRID
jgi:hypothetical protein